MQREQLILMLKWILIIIGLLAVLYGGARLYAMFVMNPNAIDELRSNPEGERAGIVMLLTFSNGKLIPVNYLREEDKVFIGADGPWWREFRGEGSEVKIEIRNEKLTGNAVAILDDPDYTQAIFERLRPKAPDWLPAWLNGKLVVITLSSD